MIKRWKPQQEGDVHPKCGTAVVRMPNMFYFRRWSGDGLVCKTCNALWSVPDEKDIFDVAREHAPPQETVDLLNPAGDSR